MKDNMIEQLLKRDRLIIIIGLFGVILVAWVYTLSLMRGFGLSDIDPEIIFPHTHAWTRSGFFLNFRTACLHACCYMQFVLGIYL